MVGHSKGGNVAIYSSIATSKEIQDRIIKVYNYDGPGFDREILDNFKDEKILKKITSYIPQDSVIGRLLEHDEKQKIVKSIETGLFQHDIYSWQILGTNIVFANKLTSSSEHVYKAIREWLKNTTPDQRKVFVDCSFEIFYSTSAKTLDEFANVLVKNMPLLFKTYRNIDEENRKIITKTIRAFAKAYTETGKNDAKK